MNAPHGLRGTRSEVIVGYGICVLSLRTAGFMPVWQAIRGTEPTLAAVDPSWLALKVERLTQRLPGDRPCLPAAMTAAWVFRRRGMTGRLVLGVKAAPFGAHAWFEHEGRVLVGGVQAHTMLWSGEL